MKLLLKLFLVSIPVCVSSQNSFIKTFEKFDFVASDVSVDKNQIYVLHSTFDNSIKLSKLDNFGNFELGYTLTADFLEKLLMVMDLELLRIFHLMGMFILVVIQFFIPILIYLK